MAGIDSSNGSMAGFYESVEPLEELNARYANMLIPFGALLGLFSAVGILGNILVIAVFAVSQEYKHTVFKTFVICLAVIDLLSCCTLIPAEIYKSRNYFAFPNTSCKVKCFFNLFSTTTAAFTLLIICIERFRKVCQPLKKQIGPDLVMKILFVMLIAAFLVSIPAPIMCGLSKENKTNVYNTTTEVYMCAAEDKYRASIFRIIYKFGVSILLLGVSIALITMYAMIMRAVVRHWGEWAPGASARFERKQSDEGTDKIEVDRLSDDAVLQEQLKALAEKAGQSTGSVFTGNKNGSPEYRAMTPTTEKKSLRKASSTSSTSLSSVKNKNVIRYVGDNRRDSESSFRAHSVRRRSSSTARNGRVPYKTMIWVVLTVVFIITYFLYAILSFFSTKQYKMSPGSLLLYTIFFRLYFINHVINPIVYMLLDKRFKSSCLALMRGLWRKCTLPCRK